MAKGETAPPAMPKREPQASISWPGPEQSDGKKTVKLTGNTSNIGLGKRCRVVVEGIVKGFRMDQWGGSLDLETKTVKVEYVKDGPADEDHEDMTDMVERMQGTKKAHRG